MEKISGLLINIFHAISSAVTDLATTVLTLLISTFSLIVTEGGGWLYVAIFLIALLESTPFLGIIIPGGILIIIAGFFARIDVLSFWGAIAVASTGAIMGDIIAYYIGKKLGPAWLAKRKRLARIISFDRGKAYFTSHGSKSIFFARFVGPVRPVIPFIAGVFHMNRSSFLFFNIIGGILWALLHLSFGYFFGASWEFAERWAGVLGFLVVATIIVWLFFVFIWKVLKSQRTMVIRLIKEVIRSSIEAVKTNEDIRNWLTRHPKIVRWCKDRFDKHNPMGRYVTYGSIIAIYCLWHTITIPFSVLTNGIILQLDTHVAQLMVQLNDTTVGTIMFFITETGSVPVVISVFTLVALLCLLYSRYRDALLGTLILASTAISVYAGKVLIHRPRPEFAPLVIEDSFSLPSGHSAHALVLYGWIIYVLLRSNASKKTKKIVVVGLSILILLVGASRIYLGVHWLSDVLTGYMVGGFILATLITIAEVYYGKMPIIKKVVSPVKKSTTRLIVVAVLVVVECAVITGIYVVQTPVIKPILPATEVRVLSEDGLLSYIENEMPKETQTLGGRAQEPISFIVVGTKDQVASAFKRSGWLIADPISTDSLSRVIWAVTKNDSYATAPVTPVFYNGYPQSFAVEKETDKGSARQRHHARFWKTDIQLGDGREVWAGTASYDTGIKRLYTHHIDPAIDTERDFMYNDLERSNVFEKQLMLQMTGPTLGRNFTGDPFFTDGKAHLIILPPEQQSY